MPKTEKPRRGRPPLEPGKARRVPVEVKVGQHDLEAIDALAAEAGETRSTWCYDAIMQRVRREQRKREA